MSGKDTIFFATMAYWSGNFFGKRKRSIHLNPLVIVAAMVQKTDEILLGDY